MLSVVARPAFSAPRNGVLTHGVDEQDEQDLLPCSSILPCSGRFGLLARTTGKQDQSRRERGRPLLGFTQVSDGWSSQEISGVSCCPNEATTPSNPTFSTVDGVASKDLHVDPNSSLSVCIFLPTPPHPQPLPHAVSFLRVVASIWRKAAPSSSSSTTEASCMGAVAPLPTMPSAGGWTSYAMLSLSLWATGSRLKAANLLCLCDAIVRGAGE
ncbi:hypothetical protein GUJ93_ZPchr0223g29168 [Zizania palustris]|uniref:Uncharacterized protein n=1 Tax=Zizania palustris TaxID=103762 RepID=A0A8J5R2P4_ZIZPA|nr:hypothetical protein GUJ93_ZPchr0223g29168 [Zizania palustris]